MNTKKSLWTRTSLFSLCGKAATLLFALFCVASGQVIRPAPGTIGVTAGGKALFASDSTPFGNIKLYLCAVLPVDYGCPDSSLQKIDSTRSDKNGYFELPGPVPLSNVILSEAVQASSGATPVRYISENPFQPKENDTVPVYMRPFGATCVTNTFPVTAGTPSYAIRGRTVTVRIPEWKHGNKCVSVLNAKGTVIARPRIGANRTVHWNTGSVARGVYFLDIANGGNRLTLKICLP